jgi:hypothetical protein
MLTPLAPIIMLAAFVIQYWLDKFNLFRRNSYPYDLGADLNRMIYKIFRISLLLSAVGHIMWDSLIHLDITAGFKAINIINLALAFAYVMFYFFAPHQLLLRIYGEETDYEHHQYKYFLDNKRFLKTYYHENPATSCLKEAQIAEIRGSETVYTAEAPDPEFIRPRDYQKYLNLKNHETYIERYDESEVTFYQKMGDKNYNELSAEIAKNAGFGQLGTKDQNQRRSEALVNPAFFLQ